VAGAGPGAQDGGVTSPPPTTPDLTAALAGGEVGELEVRPVALGELELPTGRLVAGDLLVAPGPALPVEVDPGSFPVVALLARTGPGEERVVALVVRLAPVAPVRWEKSYAADVDSGSWGFADPEVYGAFAEEELGEDLAAALEDAALPSWSRAVLPVEVPDLDADPDEEGGLRLVGNVAAVTSGRGDGRYASYLGRAADGRLVAVASGFGLLAGDDAQGAPLPPPPRATAAELQRAVEEWFHGLNRGVRGEDGFEGLLSLLDPDAELVRGGEDPVRGREAVVADVADRPPAEQVLFNMVAGGSDPEAGRMAVEVAPAAKPTRRLGELVLWVEAGRILRVELRDETGDLG